ncbi:MAG: hypothetical protein CMH58_08225 [Myxococcales bacterium]|nr:hypothetical protein [Myxococcales bacterium]
MRRCQTSAPTTRPRVNFPFASDVWSQLTLVFASGAVLAGCYTDLRFRRLPNRLTGLMAVVLLSLRFAATGPSGVDGIFAGSAAFALGLTLYLVGAFGAGDAKFLAALCLCLDVETALELCLRMALAGGILGIARLIADGNLMNAMLAPFISARREQAKASSVPYGLASGTAWVWLWGATEGMVR